MELGNQPKKQRPIPQQGMHVARCYGVIDIGTQVESIKGETKHTKKVILLWELPLVKATFDPNKGPQPLALTKKYTQSVGDKANLGKDIKAWFNIPKIETFQLSNLIGKECMINVTYGYSKTAELPIAESIFKDGRTVYANVSTIVPVMQGTQVPPLENQSILFDLSKFSWAEFKRLPGYIQKDVKNCLEFSGIVATYGPEPTENGQGNNGGSQNYQQPSFQQPSFQQPVNQPQQQVYQQPSFQQPAQQVQQVQQIQQVQQPAPGAVQFPVNGTQPQPQQQPQQTYQPQAPAYMPAVEDPFADGGTPNF